jgi:hypothetical protein
MSARLEKEFPLLSFFRSKFQFIFTLTLTNLQQLNGQTEAGPPNQLFSMLTTIASSGNKEKMRFSFLPLLLRVFSTSFKYRECNIKLFLIQVLGLTEQIMHTGSSIAEIERYTGSLQHNIIGSTGQC